MMNLKKSVLASSIFSAVVISTTAHASHPPLHTNLQGASSSSTTFAGGATFNGGVTFPSTIPADQAPGFTVDIDVDAADVGQQADIFVVANSGPNWYMRAASGWTTWNFDIGGLAPYMTRTLAANETVAITDLESDTGISLDGLSFDIYVGYSPSPTKIVYASPFRLSVSQPLPASCPAGTDELDPVEPGGKAFCILSGTYTSDLHLTSNFDYIFSGAVFIGGDNTNSAELTIDAGVTTYGESGNDFLVINRGSKIHVNGTPDAPVIMTSANDAEATAETRGQWGGLIINGNAPINGCTEGTPVCEAEGEGSTGLFGGNNPEDSSGNLNYLQVRYAGFEITPDNELNGIAFQAVGSGTNVDYVQVHNNSDDGVEFFGGTVSAKHLYLTGNADDSVDWTLGWTGRLQHVVVVQTDRGDQGIEADNNSSNRDSLPRAQPVISNLTMIGNANTDLGMLLREGTGANISNAVVAGFADGCIDIDHSATFINAGTSASSLSGKLTMTNSVVDCDVNFVVDEEDATQPFQVSAWFNAQAGNAELETGMTSYINSAPVNARTAATATDSWFDSTGYIGAVKDSASDWTAGWTYNP